ncbi:DUF6677 family protein [Isosphaeraceae bacterium EP7]
MTQHATTVPLRDPAKAAVLAWLVPGLGHAYQGRYGKAALYATCILGLYLTGMIVGEWKMGFWTWSTPVFNPDKFRWHFLGQFWVGLPGALGLLQATLRHYGHEAVMGGLFAEPTQAIINGQYARLGKLVEISSIYTVVAGLLNILAIYDAYAGPAHQDDPAAARVDEKPAPMGGLTAEATP